jgi:hypothetical protein
MAKLINTIYKVDACQDCPLHVFPDECTTHGCNGVDGGLTYTKKQETVFFNTRFRHPDCPLEKGKILIELKK